MLSWILTFVLLCLISLSPLQAATRIGLYMTAEEKTIWQARANNGPYRVAGDVQSNSPGDWTRIKANADTFVAGTTQRWDGNTGTTCYTNSNFSSAPRPNPSQGRLMRDAGFTYHILNNTTYRTAVINELITLAGLAGLQWGGSRWTCTGMYTTTANPAQEIMAWMGKVTMAYDYVRADMSGGQQATMDAWLTAFVTRFQDNNYMRHLRTRWPNRASDDYTTTGSLGFTAQYLLYFGGPSWGEWFRAWNNQAAHGYRTFGLIAIVLNNSTMKTEAKRFIKEFVRYQIWSNGTIGDSYRWHEDGYTNNNASACSKGYGYPIGQFGSILMVAEAFARTGDLELYDYTTSEGAHGSAGGSKNLLLGMTALANQGNGTVARMGTTSATKATDVRYRLDPDCSDFTTTGEPGSANWHTSQDISLAIGNRYYKSTAITQAYRRQRSGDSSYPSNPPGWSGGGTAWEGADNSLPGVLFMWGQMESQASPYVSASDTLAPKPVTGFTVTEASSSVIDLAWTPPTQNTDNSALTDLAGYTIKWCQGAACTPVNEILVEPSSTYSHTALPPVTTFGYTILARDSSTNFSTAFATQYATTETVPAPELRLHMTMDDADISGTTILDETANNHDGTTSGSPVTAAGHVAQALVCDGVNDSVRIARHANLEPAAISGGLWIKASAFTPGTVYYIVDKTWTNDTGPTFTSWALRVNEGLAGADVISFITGFDGGRHALASDAGALPVGVWVHVGFRYNPFGPSPQKSLWLDGNLSKSAVETRAMVYDTAGTPGSTATGDLYLCFNGATRYWPGQIDDVKIYDGALPDADMAALALGTPDPTPTGVYQQTAYCWGRADNLETQACQGNIGTAFKTGIPGRIVIGQSARGRMVMGRTVDTTDPTGVAVYYRSPAGSGGWVALTDNCDDSPFCFGQDIRLRSGTITTRQMVAAEDYASGGRYWKAFDTRVEEVTLPAGKSTEFEISARAAPTTAVDTTVEFCLHLLDGTPLNSCVPMVAKAVGPSGFGQ